MTDVEMLRLACKEEDKAIELYEGMMKEHRHLEDILLVLISEERKHKKLLEKKIADLTRF